MKILDSKRGNINLVVTLLVALGFIGFAGTTVATPDFTFAYDTVYASGADTYLVAQSNAVKYAEDFTTATYWGPSANDVPASLTYQFDFPQPTSNIFLNASLASFNFVWGDANGYFGSGTGSSSLWASTDGSSWQLLLNNPMPTNFVASYESFSNNVPSFLLGSTSFWLQVRMQVDNAPNGSDYTDAQFSRNGSDNSNNIFEIDVYEVPEPATFALVAGALGSLLVVRRRSP